MVLREMDLFIISSISFFFCLRTYLPISVLKHLPNYILAYLGTGQPYGVMDSLITYAYVCGVANISTSISAGGQKLQSNVTRAPCLTVWL